MERDQFQQLVTEITAFVAGKPVERTLGSALNERFPADCETFRRINRACLDAIAAGWMCYRGEGARKFGRVIEAGPDTHGLSVDVVDITDFKGPHHRHPNGEICMVMPMNEGAQFCGQGAGWCVFPPGSAHHPTVTGGRALVLYMLPDGAIEFTE